MIFNINSTRGHTGSLLVSYYRPMLSTCFRLLTCRPTYQTIKTRYLHTESTTWGDRSP